MCRLFGLTAGQHPVSATFWLLDAPDSLERQSHDNPDGCGLAGFAPDGDVELHKAPVAAWDDPGFGQAARVMTSTTFVGHVRHASTGANTYVNTHPFVEGRVAFAHNGALGGLDRIEDRLGAHRAMLHGDTDSERLFALVMTEAAARDGDIGAGIAAATTWLADHVPVLSLNMVVITPTDLWAVRYPATDELHILRRPAGGQHGDAHLHGVGRSGGLRVRSADLRGRPAVVVASERIDENPGWQALEPGDLIHVDRDLGLSRHRVVDHPPRQVLSP